MSCICVCVYGVCMCVACVYDVYMCVCMWCGVCVCVCLPGRSEPLSAPSGCCGAETHPTVCRGLSPTWTLLVNRRGRGPRGVWGAALVGGVGAATARTNPLLHLPLLCVLQARPLCFLPAGTQHCAHGPSTAEHTLSTVGAGETGPGWAFCPAGMSDKLSLQRAGGGQAPGSQDHTRLCFNGP